MPFGKILILAGLLLMSAGIVLIVGPKIPWVGRLPGDIFIQRERFTFSFPIATSVLMSLFLTLILNLFFRR